MQRFLLGLFIGWTCGAVYIATHEDKTHRVAIEEHGLRIRAEMDRDLALGREASAKAELDTVRRNWMRNKIDWGRVPPNDGERIPAQKPVVVPTPEELGIELK